ncbi:MAG: class I SAM-dependent methyltransferase [Candidatus Falkowbacteria bacterium]|nr:class I SAM-dependent methyltransferase [Candidatus Falkowbacteria bacterium]
MNQLSIIEKIKKIKKTRNFSYLLDEKQDKEAIKKYYRVNKLAYLLFHNTSGYLHMGISENEKYKKSDLTGQVKIIAREIKEIDASKILELGYGCGTDLSFLAKIFPDKEFIGVDLANGPLKKNREKNINFIKGDFNDLKRLDDKFNVVFAIETLCYSSSLSQVLKEVNSVMATGGRLIIFDAYYLSTDDEYESEIEQACQLVEHGMAVDKFHKLNDLRITAEKAGFLIKKEMDLSDQIFPTMRRFEKLAERYFKHPFLSKIINFLLPEMFIRNSLAGYLMPELVKSKIAGYYMHIFEKTA